MAGIVSTPDPTRQAIEDRIREQERLDAQTEAELAAALREADRTHIDYPRGPQ